MTRTVKLDKGGRLVLDEDALGDVLWVEIPDEIQPLMLSPRDVGRVIAALTRTKAALADRRARVGLKGQTC